MTLYEAVLGGKVRVPTLDGAVELSIPPNTSSGRTFRLKGKGLPAKDGAGDLMATVRIVLPESSDQALEELMTRGASSSPTIRAREWAERARSDVRSCFAQRSILSSASRSLAVDVRNDRAILHRRGA